MILDVLVAGGVIGIAWDHSAVRDQRLGLIRSHPLQECVCFIRMLAVLADHGYQRIVGRIWLIGLSLIGHIKLWNDSDIIHQGLISFLGHSHEPWAIHVERNFAVPEHLSGILLIGYQLRSLVLQYEVLPPLGCPYVFRRIDIDIIRRIWL